MQILQKALRCRQVQAGAGNWIIAYGQQVDQAQHSLHMKAMNAFCCRSCQSHKHTSNVCACAACLPILAQLHIKQSLTHHQASSTVACLDVQDLRAQDMR